MEIEEEKKPDTKSVGAIKLGRLRKTNPRLDQKRVRILKALYRGGSALLHDAEIMNEIFPQYSHEQANVYEERKRRAFYENMFALVVNQISAGLAQDPVRLSLEAGESVDDYWMDLLKNATVLSDDGSSSRTLDQVLRDVCVEGLVTGWAWLQADLPPKDDSVTTLKEQEEGGKLRAYLIPWNTDSVTDWEEKKGRLLWVRTYEVEQVALNPGDEREDKLHIWTIWTPTHWHRYEYLQVKGQSLPGDEHLIGVKDEGQHSFGRVPWTRFDVSAPSGTSMWIGDMIESLCRNYFNRQNGESFQWSQYYYQQLYEFLAPEITGIDTMISEAQSDPQRAQRKRAPGMVHVRGHQDKAEFIGPNMSGASTGRDALIDMRDGIMRVTQQMALAQDSNGALLRRSAASKQQDARGTEILLGAIGKRLIVCANNAAELLHAGRQDTDDPPEMTGYENFDVSDAGLILEQASVAMQLAVPSATYQREMLYNAAIAHLGDNISEDVKKTIKDELEEAITQDQFIQVEEDEIDPWTGKPLDGEVDPAPPGEDEDEEVPEEEEEKSPFPPKKKGKPF